MDQFVVDAGDLTVEPGEPVTIFGDGSHGEPTANDWADWAGTIPHEIYCGLGSRVPRRYEEGTPMKVAVVMGGGASPEHEVSLASGKRDREGRRTARPHGDPAGDRC